MRGLAAIAVALFHFDKWLVPHGYLAVDFFFALSGFVLVKAYRERFAAGLGMREFMIRRVVRLYPVFLCGLVLSSAWIAVKVLAGSGGTDAVRDLLGPLPFNLLMLPSPLNRELFPLNGPAWSLFFEIAANVFLAVALAYRRRRWWALLAAAAGVLLIVAALAFDAPPDRTSPEFVPQPLSEGWSWPGFHIGLLRTAYSFTLGMVLAEMLRRRPRPTSGWAVPLWLALGATLAIGVAPVHDFAFTALTILAVMPAFVAAGSRIEPPPALRPVARWAGDMSFALYAVHAPIAQSLALATARLDWPLWLGALLYLAVALMVATLVTELVDKPLRAFVARRRRGPLSLEG
ncbi:MAG TPA: acyltransferase [Croceibacterium sp.]|nr:acyltransferase [Croceibacterium sp.]